MRTFQEHYQRPVQSLNGIWDFVFLGEINPDQVKIENLNFDDCMPVPGCFDATPAYAGKRGLTAYRKSVLIPVTGHQRLLFDGVSHWCRVFINRNTLGEHAGGFVPFHFDFELEESGWVELIVLVDNQFNTERSPLHLDYFDWYHYGGISRSIELHCLGSAWIEEMTINTIAIDPPTVDIEINLLSITPTTKPITVFVNDTIVFEKDIEIDTAASIHFQLEMEGAHLWSPEHPHLNSLAVIFGEDDRIERFGLRTVETKGQNILLNGKPLQLLGFNRHEIHPDSGHTIPDNILTNDIQHLKNLGCNFIRGSHYPQDPRFLDRCDEEGLLVWSESIGWQHTREHLTDPAFILAQSINIHEMIAAAKNHPSVILWGILNESHSESRLCRPAYKMFLETIREDDPTRPVTYATCHPYEDLNYDLVDVISINRYPGWYEQELEDIPVILDQISKHLEETGFADKPLIISEIGAGAVPGWRDQNESRWTEQYQRKLYEIVIQHLFETRNRVCGLAFWVFADFRSSERISRITGRPRGYNNKGCLDEYRRPKLSYNLVKEKFTALARKNHHQ